MKRKHLYLVCSALFFTAILSGCHFIADISDEESLVIKFPDWPPSFSSDLYPPLSRWRVTVNTITDFIDFTTDESYVKVIFKKNQPACILAQPVTLLETGEETTYFKPAGYIYPYSFAQNTKTTAQWEQGFIAAIMNRIINSKLETGVTDSHIKEFLTGFNWIKAEENIENKIQKSRLNTDTPYFNPWLIDSAKLLDNLCYGNFKSSYLNLTGTTDFNLDYIFPDESFVPLSSFVLENEYLYTKNKISLKNDELNFFYDGKNTGVVIKYNSRKKVSKEFIHMPIYIEDI